MVLKYMKRSEDVQEGDRLITSGMDGVFPKGMMVGTVIKVLKQHIGLFQFVEVLAGGANRSHRRTFSWLPRTAAR